MAEENKIRDAADAIKGVAEAVPIYQDLLQPSVKEVGIALQTVTKTIHIALAPVAALVWSYDKIKDYLGAALTDRLKYVPPERIITPNPAVAGPTVEALKFVANEPALREMYANLLATSMDAQTTQNAHPAFVQIISQMTGDEAKIFAVIAAEQAVHLPAIITGIASDPSQYEQMTPSTSYKYRHLTERSQCAFPALIPSYLDNLRRLGIVERIQDGWIELVYRRDGTVALYKSTLMGLRTRDENPGLVERLKDLLADEVARHPNKDTAPSFGVYNDKVELTSLGQQFSDACVVPPGPK